VGRKAGLTDAEAQDVVQETFASVAKHMPGFRYDPAIGSFKAWLLVNAKRRIITQLRKRLPASSGSHAKRDDTQATATVERIVDPSSQDFDRVWELEWERNLLGVATINVKRRLDPQKYQVFDLYVNREWPAQKVAERFDMSVDHVYVIKHRVTELLKEEVARLETKVV
jgi:RNA polymerase sigma-70 factor (ECF subfamily)